MSKTDETSKQAEFREIIRENFAPHTKSKQYRYDHPDGDLPNEVKAPSETDGEGGVPPIQDPHNDAMNICRRLGVPPVRKFLDQAERQGDHGHPVARYPQALAHFITHIPEWQKWRLSDEELDLENINRPRRRLFEWYLGHDKDDPKERKEAKERRMRGLTPGGNGIIIHGEQGSTKTTAMYWLIANIMQINQDENVIWMASLDDTEWKLFAPWATLCLPENVEVEVTANPYPKEYDEVGAFEIEPTDVARQVIRYQDPEHLTRIMADRKPGHFYVVYPDPHFRKCQSLVNYPYDSMWEVDESHEATDLKHYWFALTEGIVHSNEYGGWTTLVGDEAYKWLLDGASDEKDKWYKKIKNWATYWGDARKHRLSCILAVHEWKEIHYMVRGKIRWGGTMNRESFPSEAPIDGQNRGDQGLGDMCIWEKKEHWNHVGYGDLKRRISIPGEIGVSYPGFEAVRDAKS